MDVALVEFGVGRTEPFARTGKKFGDEMTGDQIRMIK